MPAFAALEARWTSDNSGLDRGIAKARSGLTGVVRDVAGVATVAGGLVVGNLINKIGNAVGELAGVGPAVQAGMANVDSIIQTTETNLAKLQRDVVALAGPTAQLPKDLVGAAYEAASSGFTQTQDLLRVVEASGRAATAGLTTADVAGQGILKTLNAYNLGADQAARVSDVWFATVANGMLTFEQLVANLSDVLAVSANLGITQEELGTQFAAMTLQGANAAKAETQIEAIQRAMLRPTEAMTAALEAQGHASVQAFLEPIPAGERMGAFLQFLAQAAGDSDEQLFELLGTSEAYSGVLQLLNPSQKGYNAQLDAMFKTLGKGSATQAAFDRQMRSATAQWRQAKIAMQQLSIAGFAIFAPLVTKAATTLTSFITGAMLPLVDILGVATRGKFGFMEAVERLPQPVQRAAHAIGVMVEGFADLAHMVLRGDFDSFLDRLPGELRQIAGGALALAEELFIALPGAVFDIGEAVITGGVPRLGGALGEIAGDLWGWVRGQLFGYTSAGSFVHGGQTFEVNRQPRDASPIDVGTAIVTGALGLGGDLLGAAGNLYGWIKGKLWGEDIEVAGFFGTSAVIPGGGSAMDPIDIGLVVVDGALDLGDALAGVAGDLWGWLKGKILGGPAYSTGGGMGMADRGATGSGDAIDVGTVLINAALDAADDLKGWLGAHEDTVLGWIESGWDATVQLAELTVDAAIAAGDVTVKEGEDATFREKIKAALEAGWDADPIEVTPAMEMKIERGVEDWVRDKTQDIGAINWSPVLNALAFGPMGLVTAANAWATKTLAPDIGNVIWRSIKGAVAGLTQDKTFTGPTGTRVVEEALFGDISAQFTTILNGIGTQFDQAIDAFALLFTPDFSFIQDNIEDALEAPVQGVLDFIGDKVSDIIGALARLKFWEDEATGHTLPSNPVMPNQYGGWFDPSGRPGAPVPQPGPAPVPVGGPAQPLPPFYQPPGPSIPGTTSRGDLVTELPDVGMVPPPIVVPVDADLSAFSTKLEQAWTAGGLLASETFRAILDADSQPLFDAANLAYQIGNAFAAETFRATLDADSTPLFDAANLAYDIGNAWRAEVFSASFSIDTSGISNAVAVAQRAAQTISDLLPHSPAKRGPLARPISFQYLADSLRDAMAQARPLMEQGFADFGMPGGASGSTGSRSSLSGPPAQRQPPPVYVFQSLRSEELVEVLQAAREGSQFAQRLLTEMGMRFGVEA